MSTIETLTREAITESAQTDSIVRLRAETAAEHAEASEILMVECDDNVGGYTTGEGGITYTDYWGTSDSGDWRVHLYDIED